MRRNAIATLQIATSRNIAASLLPKKNKRGEETKLSNAGTRIAQFITIVTDMRIYVTVNDDHLPKKEREKMTCTIFVGQTH